MDENMNVTRSLLLNENESDVSPDSHGSTSKEMDVDEVLASSANYGRFQLMIQILAMYINMTTSYQIVLPYFIGNDPPWTCTRRNSSKFCLENYGQEVRIDSRMFPKRCQLPRNEWKYTKPKSYSYVTEFDLVCDKNMLAALLTGVFFIGGFFVSLITGYVADRHGRKFVIIVSCITTVCASILCSYVRDVWELIFLRILLGAGACTCYALVLLLLLEFMTPKSRAISTSIYLLSFSASLLLIVGVGYNERDWRKLNLDASLPSISALSLFLFIPESPRWFLAKKKIDKAVDVLKRIARCNGKPLEHIHLKEPHTTTRKHYTYMDLFSHWKVLLITLSLGFVYGAMALVYYQIALESSNLGGDIYETFTLSALADIPSYFVALYTCNRFGRKNTVSVSLFLSGIMIGSIASIPPTHSSRYAIRLALALASKVFVNIGFMGIYIWAFEIFPTVLRSQGFTVCGCIEKIAALSIPFITSGLQEVNVILPYALIGVIAVLIALVVQVLPETNKLPTRETYEDMFSDDVN